MPGSTAVGARVMLPFGEEDVECKKYSKENADFNHMLRSVRPQYLQQILRMYW